MSGWNYRILIVAAILAGLPGCLMHQQEHAVLRLWADYNTLRQPALFLEQLDHKPYRGAKVGSYAWAYGKDPGHRHVYSKARMEWEALVAERLQATGEAADQQNQARLAAEAEAAAVENALGTGQGVNPLTESHLPPLPNEIVDPDHTGPAFPDRSLSERSLPVPVLRPLPQSPSYYGPLPERDAPGRTAPQVRPTIPRLQSPGGSFLNAPLDKRSTPRLQVPLTPESELRSPVPRLQSPRRSLLDEMDDVPGIPQLQTPMRSAPLDPLPPRRAATDRPPRIIPAPAPADMIPSPRRTQPASPRIQTPLPVLPAPGKTVPAPRDVQSPQRSSSPPNQPQGREADLISSRLQEIFRKNGYSPALLSSGGRFRLLSSVPRTWIPRQVGLNRFRPAARVSAVSPEAKSTVVPVLTQASARSGKSQRSRGDWLFTY